VALQRPSGEVAESEISQGIAAAESFRGDGGLDPAAVLAEIKDVAWETIGVVRNERVLKQGVARFEQIRREKMPRVRSRDQRGWIMALECGNLVQVGEMVAQCALERIESRGQHYRDDYPQKSDANLYRVTAAKTADGVVCRRTKITFAEGDLEPSQLPTRG
jgi:succinate dehydrogenase/fumarate reductase flavoprotein subunit